jgi:lysozyme
MPTLKEQLVLHEALRLKPYRCTSGKLTIGIGRNLDDKGISVKEAHYLADNDIAEVEQEVYKALPWAKNLDFVRQKVLLDMAFNMGTAGLLKFKNTLKAVKEKRWKDAAAGMRASLWAKQTKSRADRLIRMMETGTDYTT